ncbi:dr1-associated corepressor homolog [Toxorhynchites rutilus septentrionalis]|uniref:dr1-associated corepressor homolog n=1 Tax=Toxorhynchites rutilus septentrionalis TaxID=329112 RepID=UPI0024787481|nr:dr1-associated corepressor homolog [Toxorhynchites rutilus septentrionalis]
MTIRTTTTTTITGGSAAAAADFPPGCTGNRVLPHQAEPTDEQTEKLYRDLALTKYWTVEVEVFGADNYSSRRRKSCSFESAAAKSATRRRQRSTSIRKPTAAKIELKRLARIYRSVQIQMDDKIKDFSINNKVLYTNNDNTNEISNRFKDNNTVLSYENFNHFKDNNEVLSNENFNHINCEIYNNYNNNEKSNHSNNSNMRTNSSSNNFSVIES